MCVYIYIYIYIHIYIYIYIYIYHPRSMPNTRTRVQPNTMTKVYSCRTLPNTRVRPLPNTRTQWTQPNTRSSPRHGTTVPNPRTQMPNTAEHAFTPTQPQARRDWTNNAEHSRKQRRTQRRTQAELPVSCFSPASCVLSVLSLSSVPNTALNTVFSRTQLFSRTPVHHTWRIRVQPNTRSPNTERWTHRTRVHRTLGYNMCVCMCIYIYIYTYICMYKW